MYVWSFSSIRGPMCSWEMLNFAYLTSFQKNYIGWPQQPPTEKMLKFNMIFHYSTTKNFFSKHKNKAEFKCQDDSEVLSSDFPGLRTSVALMIVTALRNLNIRIIFLFCSVFSWKSEFFRIFQNFKIKF